MLAAFIVITACGNSLANERNTRTKGLFQQIHHRLKHGEYTALRSRRNQLLQLSLKRLHYVFMYVVVLEETPCPRRSSSTNLQVLVLVLEP